MQINLHTHTPRCNHAKGSEREYIERAIESGIRTLGFADHSPMPFEGDYYSNFRMRVEQTEDYVNTLLDLRREYKNDIELLIGFEAEYYPKYFNRLIDMLSAYPVDYLLLGQHYILNEENGAPYSAIPTDSEEVLKLYVDQTSEGLATGCFTYFAHPDLIRYIGDDDTYCRHMRRLCENVKKLNIPLELNLLGVLQGRNYPDARFLRLVSEVGNKVVMGTDAHRPEQIGDKDVLRNAHELVRKYNLQLVEPLPLRDPFHRIRGQK